MFIAMVRFAIFSVRDDGDCAGRHRGILSKTGLEKLRAHSTLAALQQEGTAFSESCAPCRDDRRLLLKAWGSGLFLGGFRLQLDIVLEAHRSEERRVGKECVSTRRYRGAPYH